MHSRTLSFLVVFACSCLNLLPGIEVQRLAHAQREASVPDKGQPPVPSSQTEQSNTTAKKNSKKEKDSEATTAVSDKSAADKPADKPSDEKKDAPKSATTNAADRKSATKAAEKPTAKRVVRVIEMSGSYVDFAQPLGFDATELIMGSGSLKQKSFYKLCDYLDELAKDATVAHLVLDLSDSGLEMNPAQLDELDRRLSKFKAAGKKIYAWLENPSNVHLSIAAASNEIVLADFGGVDMPSTTMQSMFYRDAMDLLGVQASVVRCGDFKGAVEPYLNPQMSDHLRDHYLAMLTSINDAQIDRIAKGRGLTVAAVRELQKTRMFVPEEALAKKLVDHLAPYGSMKETINKLIGEELEWTKPKAPPKRDISMFELMGRLMSGDKKPSASIKEGSIAVLHLSGVIVDGKKDSPGSIVAGPTVKTIQDITNDDKIKGVVVRINSPGGSATASESIRRALDTMAQKKPTMISMGEMAASGGYWISCINQPIYAEKGTITGSIGVFSLKISFGTLLRRVGVHVEAIALDDAAKSDSIARPWSDQDLKLNQSFVDSVYEKFLKLVSQSRGIELETLNSLAGGRVWSGAQAKQLKLVDEIGGLDDCLTAVAKKAKLDKFEVIHRPVIKSGFDLLEMLGEEDPNEIELKSLANNEALDFMRARGFHLETTLHLIQAALQINAPHRNVWALCPAEFAIR